MPTLNPKPDPFRQGATKLSAEALDQMRRGQERQIVGGEDTNVSYYGDRVLIHNRKSTQLPDVTNYVAQFKVVEELDDYLRCQVYTQPVTEEGLLTTDSYSKDVEENDTITVYVAKPFALQKTPWDDKEFTTEFSNISRFVYDGTKAGLRTVVPVYHPVDPNTYQGGVQKITPAYLPGDIILACSQVTGLTEEDGSTDIVWMDVNAAGRHWGDSEGGFRLITTNHTITLDDHLFLLNVDATQNDVTITLPSSPVIGFRFWLRRIDQINANTCKTSDPVNHPYHLVQVQGTGLESGVPVFDPFATLGGIYTYHSTNTGFRLEVQYETWCLEYDGFQWLVLHTNQRPNVVFGYDGVLTDAVEAAPFSSSGVLDTYTKKSANCTQTQYSYYDGIYVLFHDHPNYSAVSVGCAEAQAFYNPTFPLLKPGQRGIMTEREQKFWGPKWWFDGITTYVGGTYNSNVALLTTPADTTSPTIVGRLYVTSGSGPEGDGVVVVGVNSPFSNGTSLEVRGHESCLMLSVQKSDPVNPGAKPATPRPSIKYRSITDSASGTYFNFLGMTVCGGVIMGLETFGDVYNVGRVILGGGGTLDDGINDTNIQRFTSLAPGVNNSFLRCNSIGEANWQTPGGTPSGATTDDLLNSLISILTGMGLIGN